MPFERASEVLFETTGMSTSTTKIRMITEEAGADTGRLIEDEISSLEAGILESLPPAGVLVVGADGHNPIPTPRRRKTVYQLH